MNTVGGYLSPDCGGGKITSTQFFHIDKGILQWCAKGIVIINFMTIPLAHQLKNAINKMIIERPIFFPRLRRGKNIRQEP